MKNKTLWILLAVLVVLIAGAAIAYDHLAPSAAPGQLSTQPTAAQTLPPETQAPSVPAEATEATEATEPEPLEAVDFTVYDYEGNEAHLFDFVGKPIVLNFWATWCGPCKSEMPTFNKVYEDLGGEVVFLMINAGEKPDVVSQYATLENFSFPIYIDTSGGASGIYGIYAFPTTFFINAQGHVVASAIGAIDKQTLMTGIDMIYQPES